MAKATKSKKKTPMEELTKGYEKFILKKTVNKNGMAEFRVAIKKAAKPSGSK